MLKGRLHFSFTPQEGAGGQFMSVLMAFLRETEKKNTTREPVAKQYYIFNHTYPLLPLLHIKLWACTSVAVAES